MLILSHFSLPTASWEERLDAAVAGGFGGVGLYDGEYLRLVADGWDDDGLAAALAERGLVVPELEVARSWGAADVGGGDDLLLRLGETFGADHVQAVAPIGGGLVPDGVAAFGRLCDAAAEVGMRVALEFLPEISDIGDVASALAFVEEADRPNGGLCVDTWHFERGMKDWDALAAVPPDRIVSVQLDDGPRERVVADYLEDTLHHRCPPGDGEFELRRFFAVVRGSGWDGDVSVEVIDDDLVGRDPVEVGVLLGDATRRVLAA